MADTEKPQITQMNADRKTNLHGSAVICAICGLCWTG
jgi:hypothetical protein